jgi:iron complex outermembrane recepter protein
MRQAYPCAPHTPQLPVTLRLAYNIAFSYADAKLTSDFSLPANDGSGTIVPGLVTGVAGQQRPGSPKISSGASILYDVNVSPDYDLSLSLNHTYRSHAPVGLSLSTGADPLGVSSAYGIFNASATLIHKPWRLIGYVTNLADKTAVLVPPPCPI